MNSKVEYERINNSGMRFARKKLLGKGGNAIVYLGFFKKTKVAVKRCQIVSDRDPEIERERRELHLRLNHKNVLKIFAIEFDRDFWY